MIVYTIICFMTPPAMPVEVLDTAAKIVAAEGPEALTMERLARTTGRSRATLYRQCGAREALLDALAERGADVGDRTAARKRVLRAAREVFGRVGFEAAAIDDIAMAADVGVVTIYRHFGDKEGLVSAFLDELEPKRAAQAMMPSNDPRKDLTSLAAQMLVGMRDDAALVRLLLLETLHESPLLKRLRAKSPTRMLSLLASLVQTHCAAGRLRRREPRLLAQSFAGMVFAFGVLAPIMRGDPAPDPQRTAEAITDLFLFGASAPAGGAQ